MADDRVKAAQRFINSYDVEGIPKVEVNGRTSWTVMRALTRILQFHLNLSPLADTFGPGTLAALQNDHPAVGPGSPIAGINGVVQSALWCKGYDGGPIDGVYDDHVAESVAELASDAGLTGTWADGAVRPKLFKALLTMDAYVTISGGSKDVRSVQQWMNQNYLQRRDYYLIPCDGHFSRDVQKALMLAIQYQLGMADGVANGVFGPGTKQGLRDNPVQVGATGDWARLFSAALLFNRRPSATFSSTFTSALSTVTRDFQEFVRLPLTGRGDFQTWASLLVSYGDNARRGSAADTATELTTDRLAVLRAEGYSVVGRYLCNVAGSTFNKQIQPGELARCVTAGMRVFPIFQLANNSTSAFNYTSGTFDALNAIEHARRHGFKPGTTIYFAVDFDALDDEVTDYVLPYFRGVDGVMSEHAQGYAVGVYGARNICSRVSEAGLATSSFVLDMSSGYSGNLGYPHPINWAFDQISTLTFGSGSGKVQVDNNIASGRDAGQIDFDPRPPAPDSDIYFDPSLRDPLLEALREYLATWGYGDTGSPDSIGGTRKVSTPQALDKVLSRDVDWVLTDVCRRLNMRKALAQAVLFQELRHYSSLDDAADGLVVDHYEGTGMSIKDDSSTGIAQMFARVVIRARNYCIGQSIITGVVRNPESETDIWAIWKRLRNEDVYSVTSVPLVLIHAASMVNIARPDLQQNRADARRTIARFNGTNADAEVYGDKVAGYYDLFEIYNSVVRA